MAKKLQTIEFDVNNYIYEADSDEMIEELEERGYHVLEPQKPDSDFPKLARYLCDIFGVSYQAD